MRPSRPCALLLAAGVAGSVLAGLPTGPAGAAGPSTVAGALRPADGIPRATLTRTSYGIPHVKAQDFASLGYGQGFATAEDTICQLADTLVTGRGERSLFFGPEGRYDDQVTLRASNLQVDTVFANLRSRKVVEGLLADPSRGPGAEVRAIVEGYVAGINGYVDSVGGPGGITDPACKGAPWVRDAEPLDLYYGIYAANLLASSGVFVPQIADADPPTVEDPGLPVGFADVPVDLPNEAALLASVGKDPASAFGSNGTAVGGDATVTGRGMVLGNPHFPWRGRYRFTQSHLTIPGVYDVAGAMLNGSPVVNIGWNDDVAWTHTVSTGYRFTPYEYRLVPGAPTTYVSSTGPRELVRDVVPVRALQPDGRVAVVETDLYRTDQGFVLDAPEALLGWTPASVFALRDANAEHLMTLDAFHEMAKTASVGELLEAQNRTAGIPWVNTLAADSAGDALYADSAVVPNVPDDLVQQCATPIGQVLFNLVGLPALDGGRADLDCAWRTDADSARPGIFGPGNQPSTVRRDFVVNANDSYWLPNPEQELTGFARIIGCEECERTLRTRMVYRYVLDRLDGSDGRGGPDLFTHQQLMDVEYENRVFAAELAREDDDLQEVCVAAGGGQACDVLAGWTGRDDIDAVGAILFREFWLRTPAADRFVVPFDADDPVATPRDLAETSDSIVQAMRDALAALEEAGIPFDAPLGAQQVAGDDGAPRIPVGGGPFDTGNANAIVPQDPASNLDARYPVSYGSSHIQAVAFTDEGVDAATILTYGVSTDPTRRSSTDQTELFGQERWVDFPFTAAEIAADEVSTVELVGAPLPGTATPPGAAAPGAEAPDVAATPTPAGGRLAATGAPALLPVVAGGLLGAGLLVRRRRGAGRP